MKIVLLTTEIRPFCKGGGAGSFNEQLIEYFKDKNVDFKVITYNLTGFKNEDNRFIFIKHIKLPIIGSLLSHLNLSFKSRKHVSDADIILTDDFGGNLNFINNKKILKIVFAHTTIEHILNINLKLSKNLRYFFEKVFYSFFEKRSIIKSDIIFAPTIYAYKIIENLIGRTKPFILTPLGIENYNTKKGSFHGIKNIIRAGGISKRKGIEKMIDIHNEINKINRDIKLTIVGATNKEVIEKYIYDKKYNINIEIKGFMTKEKLYGEFIKSDLILSTSYSENFPIILLEGAMLKVPIAFIKNGGAETIWNENEAIIFEKADSNEKIASIILSIENNKIKKNIENAYHKYSLNYTKDVAMGNIYNNILNQYENFIQYQS